MNDSPGNRPLTEQERRLLRWMLEHGKPEALAYIPQLVHAQVTPWRCPCGCASFNLSIEGQPAPDGGMRLLADFLFGEDAGTFVFHQSGVLGGLEIYGFVGDAPRRLPTPEELRPIRP
jgi:hypothetical protein